MLKLNLKKILVPTDFSQHSLRALHYAAAMAKYSGAKIILFHVMEGYEQNSKLSNVIDVNHALHKAVEEQLNKLKNEHIDLWGIEIEVRLVTGKIHQQIQQTIKDLDIDLLIMGTHGSSGFGSWEKFVLGSNTIRLVRMATCPVISIREPVEDVMIKKILLPLDTTKDTRQKIASAIKIAKVYGATIQLVSVSTNFDRLRFSFDSINKFLNEVAKEIIAEEVPVELQVIKSDDVPQSLVDYAESHDSDLIIIMTREESRLTDITIGSSARKVISKSKVPVLSLRPEMV